MSKYPFTTPSTVRNNSHNKANVYEVTGYKIETDNEGNPTSKGWEEAALIMERYGYSDYESSRYLFISKDGTINRHLSFSNGIPNSTRPYPSTQELNEIRNYAQKTDSKIIFFHNHPNGYAEPSEPDIKLTEKLKSLLTDNSQKERLLGHIILDTGSGTYGFYDCNFSSWSMHYDGTLHSIKEYETDIKNRKLTINHNISSDPDREYFFLRIGDRKTNEQLGEVVQFIQKEESFFTKDSYIPVFFLKEYGVLEHLDYIHVSKFDDYTSLDEKLRSIGTLTGSTRCYMFPATYEQFALCTNYAERTFTEPKTNKVYNTGIVEGVFCTAPESKKQLNKTYNRSIFDGFYNPFVKFREDSRDFPLGIEMDSYNKVPSIVDVTSEVLLDYSKKHSLWPLDESSAKSYIDFLSSRDIKLSLDLQTNKLIASGKTEGTVFQNNETDLFSIEAFVNQNISNLQFQKVRNANKNIQINYISNIYKELNMTEIHTKESGISLFNEEDYRISVAHEIKLNMPNLTDGERVAALAILEAGAGSLNMSLSEYVAQTFPNGIFGNVNILKNQQQKGEEINGAVDIRGFGENVRALIYAGESADFSTFVHELAHVWQAQLTGQLKSDAEKAFQVENGDWLNSIYTFSDGTNDTCGEAFAYGFEDFLKNKAGEMATEDKKKIFEIFADYMSRTYNGMEENIEISPEIAEVYNAFVSLDDNVLSQAEKAVQEEKNRTFENNSNLDNNMDSNNLQYQIISESSIRKMASSMEKNRILQNLKAAVLLDEDKKLENLTPESKAARIRMETGWEKGVDGTWKYETDDSISFIKNGSGIQKLLDQDASSLTKLSDGIPLKNLLEAPELFDIFPFMQDVKVRFYDEVDTYRGSLSSDGIMINTHYLKDVNGEKGFKGILAHEIQHIIQAVEYTGKTQLENEDIEMLYMETMKAMKENGTKYYDYDVNSVNAGISDYIKSIGEIEARNVARRIAYSATERRHKTLQSTEDVNRNLQYQILRKINEKSDNLQYQKRKAKAQEKDMNNVSASDFIKELEGYSGSSKEVYKGLIDYVYNRSAIQNAGRENADNFDTLFNTYIAGTISNETARSGLYEKIKEYNDKIIVFDPENINISSIGLTDKEEEKELSDYLSELKDSYNTLVSNLQENEKSPINEQTIQNNNQLWTDAHLRKEFIDKIRAEMEAPEMSYDDFYNLVGKVSEEDFTDEQRETLNKMILDMSETDSIEEGIKHLQNRIETDIAIDNGALWEYNDKHEKVLKQDGSYHVDYYNNIPLQWLSGNNLSEHLVKTLSETPRIENEGFIDFFKRATSDYTIAQKKELNSIIPSLVKSEPGDTPEKILSKLESFINTSKISVSNKEPSVSNSSQASSMEPVQEEKDSQEISDELRYTYTPELEKENFEPVSYETPDHIVSEQELEKGPEKTNEKASGYSYKEFLVMASELKTPEEYEKFFQENFNFKEASIKQIPPIADKKAQLFVDNKPSKLVIDYNQQEVSHLANWCLTNNMALFVPHPEDVKKQGIGLIAESLDKLDKLLGTDIKKEISGQQQGTELNNAEQKNQAQAVSGLPLLYEGSEWSEEELKLIKHVEMDKIPEFIADPYKADVAVPRFGMCLPDPETGEYKMQEQVGWHFAQKEIQNGCVSAIILTKINESGVRDFIKIDPTTYEAAINRNKELMEEWGKPRFKETHIKALYDYENALGVSKTETRSNTCSEYFHNFEAACRGAEGFDIAHNETEAMENAKQVYLKMSPHEKMRMHQMEKDWESVHGTSFHDELLRRFYEVRKDMEISQEQMRFAGHDFNDSFISKQSLEDGKVLGELDNVSHKKIGDAIKISLKSKDYNGRVLDMPVTDMKIAGANKATNTVLLVDPEKNTSYQIPFDKFVGFCQKQELKHSKEQQKVEKVEDKMQKVKQKKDIEDYGFDR